MPPRYVESRWRSRRGRLSRREPRSIGGRRGAATEEADGGVGRPARIRGEGARSSARSRKAEAEVVCSEPRWRDTGM
jgi:hypothetical protein